MLKYQLEHLEYKKADFPLIDVKNVNQSFILGVFSVKSECYHYFPVQKWLVSQPAIIYYDLSILFILLSFSEMQRLAKV